VGAEQHRLVRGDPKTITVFGESAGGSSLCDQIASPTAKGLFERGISTSGEYNTVLGAPTALETQDRKSTLPTQSQADAAGKNLAAAVGCRPGTGDVASCLRAIPASLAESTSGVGYQDGGQGTVSPTINGSTLTMSLRQALQNGPCEQGAGDRRNGSG
jgi:para-nitrobenzyl esterase